MSKKLPYFTFYANDFWTSDDVMLMTPAARGAYIMILCKSWMSSNPGVFEPDDAKFAMWAMMPPDQWAEVKEMVLKAFDRDADGNYIQPVLIQCFTDANKAQDARAKGGAAKGKQRSSNAPALLQQRSSIANRTEQNRTEQIKEYIAPAIADAEAETPLFAQSDLGGPDTLPDQTPGLGGHVDRQKTKATDKPTRKPNPAWDAVCEIWQMKPVTASDKTRVGKLARDYSAKGATLEEIKTRLDRCKRAWKDVATITPEALLKHWDTFANEPERKRDNISRVDSGRPIVLQNYVESPGFDPAKTPATWGPEPENPWGRPNDNEKPN